MRLIKAFELIQKYEGLRLDAYQDGGGIWTIGYGTTGKWIHDGLKISDQKAEELMEKEVQEIYALLVPKLPIEILNSENQMSALLSFCYNEGLGKFLGSTMYRKIHEGDTIQSIASEFDRWIFVNGEAEEGLVKRRAAEKALFLS